MYLINIDLGFKPEPYRYEYQKEILEAREKIKGESNGPKIIEK